MSIDLDPMLHNWYRHLDKGQDFRVVAVDEPGGTVDIEYFDGSLETLEREAWSELDIDSVEAPESWAGAMDIAEIDDFGTSISDTQPDDWRAPQEELQHPGERDPLIAEEESDDWEEGCMQEEPWEGEA